jgi:AraC-like DNA-binding protein/mannose-6-phosphate isomerase-like protein (cupin superfamily)
MKINTNSHLEELRNHGQEDFPFVVYSEDYQNYKNGTIGIHWHEELEFDLVVSGEIEALIDGVRYRLQAGDGIFINANALHMTYTLSKEPAVRQYSIVFLPEFLASINTSIYRNSIAPVLCQKQLVAYPLYHSKQEHAPIISLLKEASLLAQRKDPSNDMALHITMCTIWMLLHKILCNTQNAQSNYVSHSINQERAKKMLLFIKLHYDEKLEVDDIAASAGISRSECFRCFRNQLSKKPIEFLNEYRLQQAAVKLKSTTKSICEIAQECGFVHQSYFGKQFKAVYHVTPAEYRKKLY